MILSPGAYAFGPANAQLTVRTGKGGAAAKAGHNLLIEPADWQATLTVAADGDGSSLALTVDPGSMRVIEGTGGIQALGEDDKRSIEQTIVEEILGSTPIAFRSSRVTVSDAKVTGAGELELAGRRSPVAFALALQTGGRITGATTVKQSDWGIKPYSTLFGTLKVLDEVEVRIDATAENHQSL